MDGVTPAVIVAAAAGAARAATGQAARDVAGALERHARELRELGLRLAALGEVSWRSPAATAFGARLEHHVRDAGALAVRCEVAAALVRVHAEAADAALAEAAGAAARVAAGVGGAPGLRGAP